MAGVIIIPRSVVRQLEREPELLALMVFLVDRAAWHASKTPSGQSLEPGQLVTSKGVISAQFGWNQSRTYRALKSLHNRTLIELKANRRGTIVTVCDWRLYSRLPKRRRTTDEPPANRKRTKSEPKVNQKRTPPKAEAEADTSPKAPSGAGNSDWEGVEAMLADRGVVAAKAAVTAARNRNAPIEAVRGLIAEFDQHPGRYGAGALHRRVTGDLAAWPQPNLANDNASAVAARCETERAETIRRDRTNAAAAQRRADLERRFGDQLDAMSTDALTALAREVWGDKADGSLKQYQAKPAAKKILRPDLLEGLARRESLLAAS